MVDLVSHYLVVVGFPVGKAGGRAWCSSGPSAPQYQLLYVLLICTDPRLGLRFCVSKWHMSWWQRTPVSLLCFSFIQGEEALCRVQGEMNLRACDCGSGQFCGKLGSYWGAHLCLQRKLPQWSHKRWACLLINSYGPGVGLSR